MEDSISKSGLVPLVNEALGMEYVASRCSRTNAVYIWPNSMEEFPRMIGGIRLEGNRAVIYDLAKHPGEKAALQRVAGSLSFNGIPIGGDVSASPAHAH
jgi:hypothetical protein